MCRAAQPPIDQLLDVSGKWCRSRIAGQQNVLVAVLQGGLCGGPFPAHTLARFLRTLLDCGLVNSIIIALLHPNCAHSAGPPTPLLLLPLERWLPPCTPPAACLWPPAAAPRPLPPALRVWAGVQCAPLPGAPLWSRQVRGERDQPPDHRCNPKHLHNPASLAPNYVAEGFIVCFFVNEGTGRRPRVLHCCLSSWWPAAICTGFAAAAGLCA